MALNEILKGFLKQPDQITPTSSVHQDNVMLDMGDKNHAHNLGVFFDHDNLNSVFGYSDMSSLIAAQRQKIHKYRQIAMQPDVDEALDIIINEVIFSYDDGLPMGVQTSIDNEKLTEKITEAFSKIAKLTNLKRNMFQLVKRGYIDGQFNLHCAYDNNDLKKGIQTIGLIEPTGLYFDRVKNVWLYGEDGISLYNATQMQEVRYSPEEIVREDFGLYEGKIVISYLEYAIKSANMLRTLEDLLIPLRFSRSISRRVFNVDIADLSSKRGAEVMREHQTKFKYKKFYNNETGEVSNQQHITSMVEDYWFANRGGGKGTTADLLDETGNLGELDDILYFAKKLYRALKIPSNRVPGADSDSFDFDTTQVSKEDLQFFMFCSRIRNIISNLFKEVLRREIISTGVMTEDEWDEYKDDINIIFTEENKFIEKMVLDNFVKKLDIYAQTQEYQGKLFSVDTILKTVFKMSDSEITEEFLKIKKEMKDEKFSNFYNKGKEESEGGW